MYTLLQAAESLDMYAGIQPGTILIFGIVLVPVYAMIAGWFGGKPRDASVALLGVGYIATFVASLWGGLFVLSMIIYALFFSGGPLSPPFL
jgi:O-antigen ligase